MCVCFVADGKNGCRFQKVEMCIGTVDYCIYPTVLHIIGNGHGGVHPRLVLRDISYHMIDIELWCLHRRDVAYCPVQCTRHAV